jgi:4-amino-4-deoxy-L-arabinose transferase-like glycosyltransferase
VLHTLSFIAIAALAAVAASAASHALCRRRLAVTAAYALAGSLAGGWGLLLLFGVTSLGRENPPAFPTYGSLGTAAALALALAIGHERLQRMVVGQVRAVRWWRPRASRLSLRDRFGSAASINTGLVVAIVALAAMLRFWHMDRLGFSHWDEYYFISDARTVARLWPHGLREIGWFTVPLIAYTDGTLFHFFGVNNWMPFAVSAAYGTLATLMLYFLGSRLFGRGTGLVAALLSATAEFSVMYSRMALADATFDFWIITAVLFLWLGFTRQRMSYYALAGVSTGLLLNTKFTGSFPLLLAVGWLGLEVLVDLLSRRAAFLRVAVREYGPRVLGIVIMMVLALCLFTPFLLRLAADPGYHEVLAHNGFFEVHQGSPIKTPPKTILWYFWLFTSPPTVLLAIAGLLVGLLRFSRADRFLLVYTAGWFLALMIFGPYPREALSLLPAVVIWAARAAGEVKRQTSAAVERARDWRAAVPSAAAGALAAVLAVAQVSSLPYLLSMRTLGYYDAGQEAQRLQAGGASIFIHTQACQILYLDQYDGLVPTASGTTLLRQKQNLYFVTDQTITWDSNVVDLFALNKGSLAIVDRIPNPMYPEVLLQPAYDSRLEHINDPPDEYRYITVWRVTGPLRFPPNWPQAAPG